MYIHCDAVQGEGKWFVIGTGDRQSDVRSHSPTVTIRWTGVATAISSVVHNGESLGTISLLRREGWIRSDGTVIDIPLVSGNALRGVLRRRGEELMREVLQYEGELAPSVAHALFGGGVLSRRTGDPLSGARLHELRSLIPQLAIFGGSIAGRVMDGIVDVGKLIPVCVETHDDLDLPRSALGDTLLSADDLIQVEAYSRNDESAGSTYAHLIRESAAAEPSTLMRYSAETFMAGTRFAMMINLRGATPFEAAFFRELMELFTEDARVGGRRGQGHGRLSLQLTATVTAGTPTRFDWRAFLAEHRHEALQLLKQLA